MKVKLRRSTRKNKKWMVEGDGFTIHFGARGYDDYTVHGDKERKKRYLARHGPTENWTKKGVGTAGFWSRWLLWNKPSLKGSIRDIKKRFGVHVEISRP